MRVLIAEDDYASRRLLEKFLSQFGDCDLVVDGMETIDAYMLAMREKNPYDLICLDIMMPKIDGVKVLKAIRDLELQKGLAKASAAKIIMTTALGETELVKVAFEYGCNAYAAKPIDTEKLLEVMRKIGLDC